MRFRALALGILLFGGAAEAQVRVDEFGFLERWQILSEEVRLGQVQLDRWGMPPGYDTEVDKATEGGLFQVSVGPQQEPAPFNEIHTWLIRVKTPDGEPVTGADLKIYGGMPLHNHAFPTEPAITGEVAPGTYALEGVKFSMSGWWAIAMGITAGDDTDIVSFNLVVLP